MHQILLRSVPAAEAPTRLKSIVTSNILSAFLAVLISITAVKVYKLHIVKAASQDLTYRLLGQANFIGDFL